MTDDDFTTLDAKYPASRYEALKQQGKPVPDSYGEWVQQQIERDKQLEQQRR